MQVPHTALSRHAPSLFGGSGLFNPEFRSRKTCLAPSRPRFDATRLAPSALFHCGSRHAGDGTLVGAGMPATVPPATAATPVAAMAAPTDSSAPSPAIQSRASKLQDWPRGSDLAVGAGLPATAPLWEPACRRRHPPLPPRPQSLPWQLPQIQRCHRQPFHRVLRKLQDWPRGSDLAVGAGMPATAQQPIATVAAASDSAQQRIESQLLAAPDLKPCPGAPPAASGRRRRSRRPDG